MRRHLFVCTNPRSSGKPACGVVGEEILARVQNLLIARGESHLATPSGCLGPCFDGPNAVLYPDGVWYAHLDGSDAAALVEHLAAGTRFEHKITRPPGDPDDEVE